MTTADLRAKATALIADFAHTRTYCQGAVIAESWDNLTAFVEALCAVAEASKELSNMYARTWDRVDGALVMIPDGIERFEKAHADATAALSRLEELTK